MRIKELEAGKTPSAREYNEIVKKLRSLNISTRNNIRNSRTPNGLNLVGQSESIKTNLFVFGATFETKVIGGWDLTGTNAPWSCSFAEAEIGGSGDVNTQYYAIRWIYNIPKGNYIVTAQFLRDNDYGIMHWKFNDEEKFTMDAWLIGGTPQFNYWAHSPSFSLSGGITEIVVAMDTTTSASLDGYNCHLAWWRLRRVL
jgi:hypothetical protein